jgi:poly(A) polymerase Pap1
MYRDIVNNKENNKVLNEKLLEHSNLVNEYKEYLELFKKTGDRNFIKEAVGLYISKIKDLDRNIMNLKYKHNFVEEIEEVEEIENNNIIRLVQEKYNLKDLELIKKPKTQ